MAWSEFLSKVDIFEGLDRDELAQIATLCREVKFPRDAPVLRESDTGRDLYILLEGKVGIEMEMPVGLKGRAELTTIVEGEVFGEIGFISASRRSATARALDRTRVLVIDREALIQLFDQNYHMGYVVIRHLAEVLCRRLESTDFMWRNVVMGQRAV